MVQVVDGSPDGTTTITLYPVADQVMDAKGALSPGTKGLHCRSDIMKLYRTCLKFDLSGISDSNTIIGVEFKLYCSASTVIPVTLDVNIHEIGDLLIDGSAPWTEENLIWSNAPDLGELIATTAVGEAGNWYSWDDPAMTDYVKAECASDKIMSFMMKLAVEDTTISFPIPYHRDFTDRLTTTPPQLIITLVSPMTISGHEFNDLDGDGTWDQGEPALEGWTINLDGPVSKTTTSDSTGYYEFTELLPGTYTISEALQDGWIQTEPAPPGTYPVSLTSSSVTDKDFGNFRLVTITADKWNDLDGDGVRDGGEPDIPGWKLIITYPDGTTYTMDSPASWVVGKGGTYTITEEPQDGWVHTTTNRMDVNVISGDTPSKVWFGNFREAAVVTYKYEDADGDLATTGDWTPIDWPVTLTNSSGDFTSNTGTTGKIFNGLGPGPVTVKEADDPEWAHLNPFSWSRDMESGGTYVVEFVNFKKGMVSGHKFDDVDGDGSWDNGEPALKDWAIYLVGKDIIQDMPVDLTAVTDDQGYYEFRGLMAGEYTITEGSKSGWIQTTPAGGTYTIVIDSGSIVTNKDFGNIKLVTISADKFDDVNGNGVKDDGEPEIKGWKLTIACPNGTTNTMDSPASWVVKEDGDYTVAEELQEGWIPTTLGSAVVTVQSRNSPSTIWFGNFKLVNITADKFDDVNGNGVKDDGEPEIPGWKLTITCPNGTINEMGSPASWVVREGGMYRIAEEDMEGYVNTIPSSMEVMVRSGDMPDKVWFGNFKMVTINADKFDDLNGNGVNDDGEPELVGWQLTIICPNGTTSTLGSPASWVVRQGGGYTISEELQDGWVQTTASSVVITVQSGDTPEMVWFGNFELGNISGYKLNDLNGNGFRNEGEPTLEGWTIHLDGYDTITKEEVHRTTVTDHHGYYEFKGLTNGIYKVYEELKPGWIQTMPFGNYTIEITSGTTEHDDFYNFKLVNITADKFDDVNGNGVKDDGEPEIPGWKLTIACPNGTTNTMDSPASWLVKRGTYTIAEELRDGWVQTTASSENVDVQSDKTPPTVWFGNFELGMISGYKFNDLDGDSIKETNELGLNGWIIDLDGYDDTSNKPVHLTTTTDANGYYEFRGLSKGTYTVLEEPQSGWIQTKPMPSGTYTIYITTSGQIEIGKDFGNFKVVYITADKFDDLDGDGERDDGELVIQGWELTITCPNGTTNVMNSPASWVTLQGGEYTITEELREGWVNTTHDSVTITVQSGDTPQTVWFGNFREAAVVAYKYEDADGDLATTDDWTPIDWPITLTNSSGDYVGETGTTGKVFSGLGPGLVTVTEVDEAEWAYLNSSSWSRAVESGTTYVVKFVNFKLVTITADKWEDLNGNGVKDYDEPEIPGWKLTLHYPDGTANTMDSPASWKVKQGGKYTITELDKSGWVHTTASSVDVDIKSGDTPSTLWFGNSKLITITADKWNDLDGDGVRDSSEPEIAGWKLTITCPNGTTSTLGSPASWTVKQGGKYTIAEAEKSGWAHTTASSVDLVVQSGDAPSTVWFGNRQECYRKVTNGWLSDTSEQRIEVTDFNIVFTSSKGSYKISSTNPGGFYFNVLYQTGADPTTISYALANNGNGDFVTKGSMPVHAYIWNDLDKDGKIDYWGELTDITNKITTSQEPDLAKGTIKVNGVPSGTNVLITIHITFALKGTSGYDLKGAIAFEGKRYTFTANGGFSVQATLTAHVKI